MTNDVTLIEVFCEGRPSDPHRRRYIARMVRTVRMDDTTGWAVARDGGRLHVADDQNRDRIDLRCDLCPLSPQASRAKPAYDKLLRYLDAAADKGIFELPLHALAGIVSR